jgi:hypothetical protein
MAEIKTKPTPISVSDFIDAVDHPGKRDDALVLDTLFRKVTGQPAQMWGPSIIGYGTYHYRYASGHEGDMCRLGFSPRKAKHSLYVMACGDESEEAAFAPMLARLGKYSRGKGCLYVNKLTDIDLAVLEDMIALAWQRSFARYPAD